MSIKMEKKESEEAWLVKPLPGYVCKWKNVKIGGAIDENENRKCFVNVCHCDQIPPPISDIDEEEMAAKLDAGDTSYRIPICIGELDCVKDRKEENSIKIDVLVNSAFYASRLEKADSTFFRHFLALVFCDMIQTKHCIELDPMKSIILKNRAVVGELEAFNLRKAPEKRIVEEVAEKMGNVGMEEASSSQSSPETKAVSEECRDMYGMKEIDGVKIRCFDGKRLEISMSCNKVTPKIDNPNRLKLKMTPTRVLVLLDKTRSLYDFSIPFIAVPSTAKSKFQNEKNCLVVSVDIVFPR